jgi:hypothetical protein
LRWRETKPTSRSKSNDSKFEHRKKFEQKENKCERIKSKLEKEHTEWRVKEIEVKEAKDEFGGGTARNERTTTGRSTFAEVKQIQ